MACCQVGASAWAHVLCWQMPQVRKLARQERCRSDLSGLARCAMCILLPVTCAVLL